VDYIRETEKDALNWSTFISNLLLWTFFLFPLFFIICMPDSQASQGMQTYVCMFCLECRRGLATHLFQVFWTNERTCKQTCLLLPSRLNMYVPWPPPECAFGQARDYLHLPLAMSGRSFTTWGKFVASFNFH